MVQCVKAAYPAIDPTLDPELDPELVSQGE